MATEKVTIQWLKLQKNTFWLKVTLWLKQCLVIVIIDIDFFFFNIRNASKLGKSICNLNKESIVQFKGNHHGKQEKTAEKKDFGVKILETCDRYGRSDKKSKADLWFQTLWQN